MLVSGCVASPGDWQWAGTEQLSPCTLEGSPFEDMDLKKWPETYHATVSGVIDAHLEKLTNLSTADITCTAGDYASMMDASGPLQSLASSLAPWEGKTVSELEIGPVLREYLRVYECSLEEKRYFLPLGTQSSSSSSAGTAIGYGQYIEAEGEEGTLINRELASARPILERTLAIVGGLDRFQPLEMDLECVKRASLDLRNALGLAAEAAACMPRTLDIRGSLRDLKDSEPATP